MGGGDKREVLLLVAAYPSVYDLYTTIHVGMTESHLCVYFIESDVALSYFVVGIFWVQCPPRKQLKLNFHCVVGRDGSLIHCDIYGWNIREGMKVK